MITLIKCSCYLLKLFFNMIIFVIGCYFIILKYLVSFVNEVLKIEINKRKEVLKNEKRTKRTNWNAKGILHGER